MGDESYVIYKKSGWKAGSLIEAASLLADMDIGDTATVRIVGAPNAEPAGVTVSHVPDGWVLHTEYPDDPPWVGHLRQLLRAASK